MSGLGLIFLRRGNLAHPTAGLPYIKFKDAEVLRMLMTKGISSNGIGITYEDAAKVTSINGWFNANKLIDSFNEFKYFIGITSLSALEWTNSRSPFLNSSIREIELPENVKNLYYQAFAGCGNLEKINLQYVQTIEYGYTFANCTKLGIDVIMPSLTSSIPGRVFYNSGIRRVLDLGNATSISTPTNWDEGAFMNCKNLEVAIIPPSATKIGRVAFSGCISVKGYIIKGDTPCTIQDPSFTGVTGWAIYVPDASVDSYKSAWSTYASRIKGISQFATDYAELYAEIKQYIL